MSCKITEADRGPFQRLIDRRFYNSLLPTFLLPLVLGLNFYRNLNQSPQREKEDLRSNTERNVKPLGFTQFWLRWQESKLSPIFLHAHIHTFCFHDKLHATAITPLNALMFLESAKSVMFPSTSIKPPVEVSRVRSCWKANSQVVLLVHSAKPSAKPRAHLIRRFFSRTIRNFFARSQGPITARLCKTFFDVSFTLIESKTRVCWFLLLLNIMIIMSSFGFCMFPVIVVIKTKLRSRTLMRELKLSLNQAQLKAENA